MTTNIILGAPGCGKTTYLMEILEKELMRVNVNRIAYVSFTKKGAYEGRDRALEKFTAYNKNDFVYFRTLHSIAFKECKITMHDVIDKKDYKHFSDAMNMNFTGYYTEEFFNNDDKYLFLSLLKKNNEQAYKNYLKNNPYFNISILENVFKNYQRYKQEYNIIDFTDMLEKFCVADNPLPVDVAIIDEAQDLTSLQWRMCQVAFRNCQRIYIAGDDDQSIYEWSGADVNQFLNLSGNRTILNQSYRLKKNILTFAKSITKILTNKIEKEFMPVDTGGKVVYLNDLDELEKLNANETYYFLSRNNCFLKRHRKYLIEQGYIFYYKDELSINYNIIEAIKLFEQCRKNNSINDEAQTKLTPYISNKPNLALPWFDNFKLDFDMIEYYRKIIQYKRSLKNINIQINTIHGVKGGEADNVVLLLSMTRSCYESLERNTDSELRCLYVACTRAKNKLYIIKSDLNYSYDSKLNFGEGQNGKTINL
jgi:superfamily I DNA/RNA helicase